MRNTLLVLILAVFVAGLFLPVDAMAQMNAGIVIWRHTTDVKVESAIDFDGTPDLDMVLRDWDIRGSGAGFRLEHRFPTLTSIYGVIGLSQVTVRDEDVTDPQLDINSRGFEDDIFFSAGALFSNDFPNNQNVFWSAGIAFNLFSADFNEDVDVTWDYEETSFAFDGAIGYRVQDVGFYTGVRVVNYSADLKETDLTELPGMQTRLIELKRDGQVDLMFGARTSTAPVMGFVELGVVGSFSATTGFSYNF